MQTETEPSYKYVIGTEVLILTMLLPTILLAKERWNLSIEKGLVPRLSFKSGFNHTLYFMLANEERTEV